MYLSHAAPTNHRLDAAADKRNARESTWQRTTKAATRAVDMTQNSFEFGRLNFDYESSEVQFVLGVLVSSHDPLDLAAAFEAAAAAIRKAVK